MERLLISTIAVLVLGHGVYAGELDADFDSVVCENALSPEVMLGFGAHKLLDIIESKRVRPFYRQLRQLGQIEVSVQKVPAAPGKSNITRFRFAVYRPKSKAALETIGTLVVDAYSLIVRGIERCDQFRITMWLH